MDSNALYYTFSTVAQSLAAGFAVLAAFVLYRLQHIEQQLTSANSVFDRFSNYITTTEIWTTILSDGLEALETRMRVLEKERNTSFYSRSTVEGPVNAVLLWWPIWKKTVLWLKVSLITTIGDIALALSLLPLVPSLTAVPAPCNSILVAVVAIAIAALLMYGRLILLLLNPARLSPFNP